MAIPELEPHCGSWVIVSRITDKPLFETFSRGRAEAFAGNPNFEILTAAQWLARLQKQIDAAKVSA